MSEYCRNLWYGKHLNGEATDGEKVWEKAYVYSCRYSTRTCQTDRQTDGHRDGRTPHDGIGRAMHCVVRQKQ